MENFTAESKLSKVIHANYLLLPVINRFGIKLGFGDKTIAEVCTERDINTNFFLAILNTFHNHSYFPEEELRGFSCKTIVTYLRKSHSYFVNYSIPRLKTLLHNMLESAKDSTGYAATLETFYNKYEQELISHFNKEEAEVFPMVLEMEEMFSKGAKIQEKDKERLSIRSYEEEHEDVDDKLYDLKNIIIKYLEPVYNDNLCNAFLAALFQFENDLQDHARIEDKILMPKVVGIEKTLRNE